MFPRQLRGYPLVCLSFKSSCPKSEQNKSLRSISRSLEMAYGMTIAFRPAMIRANAGGSRRDRSRKSGGSGGGSSGAAWWSPLFGWAAQPDYIDCGDASSPEKAEAPDLAIDSRKSSARIFTGFTEEKAREMRMRMLETESFHDAMYHSAIASRLASDVRRGSGYNR